MVLRIKDYLMRNNEFIQLKEDCPGRSMEYNFTKKDFKTCKNCVAKIMFNLVRYIQQFTDRHYLPTQIDPKHICITDKSQAKLNNLRNFKIYGTKGDPDGLEQYLPPEYIEARQYKKQITFDDKFVSYQLGYIFYFMVKARDPFTISGQPNENIWVKEIEFNFNDRNSFVQFIMVTVCNHHLRLGLVEVFAKLTEGDKFDFGLSTLNANKHYRLGETILYSESSLQKKVSLIFVLLAFLVMLSGISLIYYLCCRKEIREKLGMEEQLDSKQEEDHSNEHSENEGESGDKGPEKDKVTHSVDMQ